jgi:hypothetical protein
LDIHKDLASLHEIETGDADLIVCVYTEVPSATDEFTEEISRK